MIKNYITLKYYIFSALSLALIKVLVANCGNSNTSDPSETKFVTSKKLDDTRVVRFEVKEMIDLVEVDPDTGEEIEKNKKVKLLRFRLCAKEATPLNDCEYLARGKWFKSEELIQASETKMAVAKGSALGTYFSGGLLSLIGAFMLKKGSGPAKFIGGAYLGMGLIFVAAGINSTNTSPGVHAYNIVIKNPDKRFKIKNLETLISELDALGNPVQQINQSNGLQNTKRL